MTDKPNMIDGLFDYLPADRIRAAFERSPGNEFGSGKFASRESSAALAANTFGLFLAQPGDLPPLIGTEECSWPALTVSIEECVPFPWWPAGRHPWLDAFVETGTHIIGIESKRYEPFRGKSAGSFSDAYWRDVWGKAMGPFERVRDDLKAGSLSFERLDAAQLIKHAFGLRTEAHRRGKSAILVYLHAEPETWPDGKPVKLQHISAHRDEVQHFAELVAGAEVAFCVCDYQTLLRAMCLSGNDLVRNHAENVQTAFRP